MGFKVPFTPSDGFRSRRNRLSQVRQEGGGSGCPLRKNVATALLQQEQDDQRHLVVVRCLADAASFPGACIRRAVSSLSDSAGDILIDIARMESRVKKRGMLLIDAPLWLAEQRFFTAAGNAHQDGQW
ncbi:hypothetical protein LNP74_10600 [Klebsiella pneumoniae subsp. pneumoniae]|nr:hypothetical protein [Klebsiella pneumoniae subsp. pneumoniae]